MSPIQIAPIARSIIIFLSAIIIVMGHVTVFRDLGTCQKTIQNNGTFFHCLSQFISDFGTLFNTSWITWVSILCFSASCAVFGSTFLNEKLRSYKFLLISIILAYSASYGMSFANFYQKSSFVYLLLIAWLIGAAITVTWALAKFDQILKVFEAHYMGLFLSLGFAILVYEFSSQQLSKDIATPLTLVGVVLAIFYFAYQVVQTDIRHRQAIPIYTEATLKEHLEDIARQPESWREKYYTIFHPTSHVMSFWTQPDLKLEPEAFKLFEGIRQNQNAYLNFFGPTPQVFHAILADAILDRIFSIVDRHSKLHEAYVTSRSKSRELRTLWKSIESPGDLLSRVTDENVKNRVNKIVTGRELISERSALYLFLVIFTHLSNNYGLRLRHIIESLHQIGSGIQFFFHSDRVERLPCDVRQGIAQLVGIDSPQETEKPENSTYLRNKVLEINERSPKDIDSAHWLGELVGCVSNVRKILFPNAVVGLVELNAEDPSFDEGDTVFFSEVPQLQVLIDQSNVVKTDDDLIVGTFNGLIWPIKLSVSKPIELKDITPLFFDDSVRLEFVKQLSDSLRLKPN